MGKIFITAFGPFGRIRKNPSEAIVIELKNHRRKILPVSFFSVDSFIKCGLPKGYDKLLMIGVHGNSKTIKIEKTARNIIGKMPDIKGKTLCAGKISEGKAKKIKGQLFSQWRSSKDEWEISNNAGNYLCNYIYFKSVSELRNVKCGFVHVPKFKFVSKSKQLKIINQIIHRLENEE